MASLPPQPTSQRRLSSREQSGSTPHEEAVQPNSFSATSEDSQTVLLNSPRTSEQASKSAEPDETHRPTSIPTESRATQLNEQEFEPRKCWICFNDETEDDETTSEWRSPCPCVLVAHEKCLLDWIADMEAPSSRRRAGGRKGQILCPQCKSEIRLERPKNVVVESVRLAERVASLFLLPGVALTIASATYSTLALVGRAQVYQVFGTQDAVQILAPLYQPPDLGANSIVMRVLNEVRQHWRLHVGLPLIPTVLIASRTTIADSFLPFLPLIFFVGSGGPQEGTLQYSWPPSAAFTIAALPYVRGVYNAYYERVWLPKEQRWLREIQPRAGSDAEDRNVEIAIEDAHAQNHDHDHDHDGEDGDIIEDAIEVEVDFDIFADWNNGGGADNHNAVENPPVPIARGPAPPLHAPPADDDAAPAPNVPQQQPQPPRRQRVRRERNIAFSTTSLADTILGALVFPSIAAAVGEALKYALPKSWVGLPASGKPTGFLQARWGRTILGGCLFVGVKDALMLYVRWKIAQNHRMRRVLDYDRKNKGDKKTDRTARM